MANIEELFGSSVFNDAVMQKRLPKDIYKAPSSRADATQTVSNI